MTRRVVVGAAVALLVVVSIAADKPKKDSAVKERVDRPTSKAQTGSPAPDFRVVFWFHDGWKHQAYDLRKGQYTKAVDDWVNRVEFDSSGFVLPGHLATVRDIILSDEQGATESEKLASAIARLQLRILGGDDPEVHRRALQRYLDRPPRLHANRDWGRPLERSQLHPLSPVGSELWFNNPPTYLFPTPYPYPRPHP